MQVLAAESLYLAWMDCRALGLDAHALNDFMLTKARVWFDKGQKFGAEGHGYMRVNLGCPRSIISEAIARVLTVLCLATLRYNFSYNRKLYLRPRIYPVCWLTVFPKQALFYALEVSAQDSFEKL